MIRKKIKSLHEGKIPIYEPGLAELLKFAAGNLQFRSSYEQASISEVDVIFIGVGTPSREDGSPNLDYVRKAADSVGKNLGPGYTVIFNKSTIPIGSGNWVGSLMQYAFQSHNGEKSNKIFGVASNPEFLWEGSALHDTLYPDRIVVGSQEKEAVEVLTNLYRPILNQDFPEPNFLLRPEGFQAVPFLITDLASAELIKYAAKASLALKISYINEMTKLSEKMGADITQVAREIGLDSRIGPSILQVGI